MTKRNEYKQPESGTKPLPFPKQTRLLEPQVLSGFGDFIRETRFFWKNHPEIQEAVELDLEIYALESKQSRESEKQFHDNETRSLELCLPSEQSDTLRPSSNVIGVGRPRMPAELVFLFASLRGFMGSISDSKAIDMLQESISLSIVLEELAVSLPKRSTIVENVNKLSSLTQELILTTQLKDIKEEGLDDLRDITIDSTAVEACSSWPTDSKIMLGLLTRVLNIFSKLGKWGLLVTESKKIKDWMKELKKLDFEISLEKEKKDSKVKRKNLYKKFYKRVLQIIPKVLAKLKASEKKWEEINNTYSPMERETCNQELLCIGECIINTQLTCEQSSNRIILNIATPSPEKLLSLSDEDAAFIKKGDRVPTIGYKPQLGRSNNGFVTCFFVKEGNDADSRALVPLVENHINNTGITPHSLSADDGYPSKEGLDILTKELGIEKVSFSGAKGRKLLGEDTWNDESYKHLRNGRSAVESLMFVLKYNHGFGRMRRTGLECVRSEMLEKILAYNFRQVIRIRKHQKTEPVLKAA